MYEFFLRVLKFWLWDFQYLAYWSLMLLGLSVLLLLVAVKLFNGRVTHFRTFSRLDGMTVVITGATSGKHCQRYVDHIYTLFRETTAICNVIQTWRPGYDRQRGSGKRESTKLGENSDFPYKNEWGEGQKRVRLRWARGGYSYLTHSNFSIEFSYSNHGEVSDSDSYWDHFDYWVLENWKWLLICLIYWVRIVFANCLLFHTFQDAIGIAIIKLFFKKSFQNSI